MKSQTDSREETQQHGVKLLRGLNPRTNWGVFCKGSGWVFKDSSEEENKGNLSPELLNSAQHLEDTNLRLSLLWICLNTGES